MSNQHPTIEPAAERIPPLEPGDRLDRQEFERRYNAMPRLKKAELIDGVVYMPSPVRLEAHGSPHVDFTTWLGTYRGFTPGVQAGDNTTVLLSKKSEPQNAASPTLPIRFDPVVRWPRFFSTKRTHAIVRTSDLERLGR